MEGFKHTLDAGSGLTALATLFHAAPDIAACFSISWFIYRWAGVIWKKFKKK